MTDPRTPTDRIADLQAEIAALRADNSRLRRLLDEEGMPDSLRHAFRDTVAMLLAIMRRTADSAEDVEDYNAHLSGRLNAIVRARTTTDAFGEADLYGLVGEALATYLVQAGERAMLDGPDVRLRPKAAEVFSLAMHELATNAVEHGTLGGAGDVTVSWQVARDEGVPTLVLSWQERGMTAPPATGDDGFGTAVLTEMLLYDLGARASLSYENDGLRCSIRCPLDDRIGRLVEEEPVAPGGPQET